MLGRFEVLCGGQPTPTFRSRKVAALLALLALNKGKALSNHTLQELLWPESDGDRQSQSLRRAISDLRDALEDGQARGTFVRTDLGKVSLNPDAVETDIETFTELLTTRADSPEFLHRASQAVALYGGPLLAPFDDDWLYAYRRQFEELYCRSVEDLCRTLVSGGQHRDAQRIASAAIVLAPVREEGYVASILAYAAADNQAMAIQQFEALEKMLDDNFGQTPSEAAYAALDHPAATPDLPVAEKAVPPRAEIASGGGLDVESRYYVEREADSQVNTALGAGEPVVLVFGPRQVGKTSLLARSAGLLRSKGTRVVVTDFQSFGKSEVERSATLYRALVHSVASQLGLSYEPSWNEWVGANSNLDSQMDGLLRQTEGRVCWAMDEVDRVFSTDYADDFFGLVRSWHNRRALDPGGPWSRLSLVISYATEAHLFIKDLNQSPFNVGLRVNLADFSEAEVLELGMRHSNELGRLSGEVYDITLGQPFLTRRAFAFLQSGETIEALRTMASRESGPFGEHLKRLLTAVRRDESTTDEIRRSLSGNPFKSPTTAERLQSAGVIVQLPSGSSRFRVPAYEHFLSAALLAKPSS